MSAQTAPTATPPQNAVPTVRSLRSAALVSACVGRDEGSVLLFDGRRYIAVEYTSQGDVGTVSAHCGDDGSWILHTGEPSACRAMLDDLGSRRRRFTEALSSGVRSVGSTVGRMATPVTAAAVLGLVVVAGTDGSLGPFGPSATVEKASLTEVVAALTPVEEGAAAGTAEAGDDAVAVSGPAAGDDAIARTADLVDGPRGPAPDVALPSDDPVAVGSDDRPDRTVTVRTVAPERADLPESVPEDLPVLADAAGAEVEGAGAAPDPTVETASATTDPTAEAGGNGVTGMDELNAMRSAVERIKRGEVVPPEIVAALPHEIAASLKAMDALPTAEETATAAGRRLVTLPETVRRRWRDDVGLPTVPPADTWTALGGGLRIPLPAGGDISTVEDLEAFGLEP